MSRYRRIEVSAAAEPCPGMRVYGRNRSGKLVRIVVHDINADTGQVYLAERVRGRRGGMFRGHRLWRMPIADWSAQVGVAFAARVPAPAEVAR